VNYKKIYGTSKSAVAVNFNCSANTACTGIKLENIKLTSSSTPGTQVCATCNNAFGEAKGIMQPKSSVVGS
jgi:polygalacturonase